jgi:hypothetical protein
MRRERTADEIVALLSAASEESFYAGLASVDTDVDPSLIVGIVDRLGTAPLPELRRSERLAAVLRKARLSAEALQSVARAAAGVSPVLANAVAPFLPPAARRRPRTIRSLGPGPASARDVSPPTEPPPDASAPLDTETCSTVIILSAAAQQDANIALLRDAGFSPFVYDTIAKLAADLASNTDICGCIIDRSFLVTLSMEEQEQLLSLLSSYSTFIWLRVEDAGLKLQVEDAYAIIRRTRLQTQPVAAHHVSMQSNGTVRGTELGALRRASQILREYTHAVFLPGELNEQERRLLVAAARDHGEQLRFDQTLKIEVIETRFVQGGQSQARVAIVRVNAGEHAVVAKIDTKDAIRKELERFRIFTQPVDDQLQPFVCFHGSTAVMFFAFIPTEDNESVAAETLQARLHRFWCDEIFGEPTTTEYDNLCRALTNTSAALARVNRQNSSQTHQALGNPDISLRYVEKLEENGVAFGLPLELRSARIDAGIRFQRLATSGVIHGDLHLGNVLLRGDRSAHLIDFAASGPGHPAVDLVRLEMALFTGCFLSVDTEERYVELQRALSIDGSDLATLVHRFDLANGPRLNRLSLHGCVEARHLALEVLAHFGGDLNDYLAVKSLVAWQTLLLENRQTSLSRAVILAISNRT